VVHTVSSSDPLEDLPASAAAALARALLVPVEDDLGTVLERCDAVGALLDRWQDAFFAALPKEIDLQEEERYAAEAGVTLAEVEEDWEDEDEEEHDSDEEDWYDGAEVPGQLDVDVVDLEAERLLGRRADLLTAALDEDLVAELERDLLLLPMRVRLEALLAASALVEGWVELLADHEKCLGHLVLAHGTIPESRGHEDLADLHATLHAGRPGHAS
jgi:hypothetical protein